MIRLGVSAIAAAKPPELRRRVLDLVLQVNPMSHVAKGFRISDSCLRPWMSINDVDADHEADLTIAERKEIVGLGRRDRVLEMELAILKRVSEYFARANIVSKQSSIWSKCSPPSGFLSR